MSMRSAILGILAGMLLSGSSLVALADEPPAEKPFAAKGEQTCLKCHDEGPAAQILKSPHAVKGDPRTPFASHQCETCHGASPEHIASAMKVKEGERPTPPAMVFKGPNAAPVEERSKVCFGCHNDDVQKAWLGSQHQNSQMACNDCHTLHAARDPILAKDTQPLKCFTCHAQQRAESFQFSHHPIREGKVTCSDCHNPHGSTGPKLLQEATVNQTCYNCHAEKRGPMLFDHEPVREDCTNCHTPHGATNPRLLKERVPFLCISCHTNVGGPPGSSSGIVSGGQNLLLGNFGRNGANAAHGAGRGCMDCHVQVHGSNSANGAALTR